MIQDRLEKQVRELKDFFENHPGKSQTVSVYEYKCILKGLIALIRIGSDTVDFTGIFNYFNITGPSNQATLISAIELKAEACKEPETIAYLDIANILTIYKECLKPENHQAFTSNEWLKLMGDLRVLEMERLGSNKSS